METRIVVPTTLQWMVLLLRWMVFCVLVLGKHVGATLLAIRLVEQLAAFVGIHLRRMG